MLRRVWLAKCWGLDSSSHNRAQYPSAILDEPPYEFCGMGKLSWGNIRGPVKNYLSSKYEALPLSFQKAPFLACRPFTELTLGDRKFYV